jgi:uncharacterized membrane protein
MKISTFRKVKIMIITFAAATVGIAAVNNNMYLALAGVGIGMLFLILVRRSVKAVTVDERISHISGRAARLTYAIVTTFIAFLSLFFISSGERTGEPYLEALGTILSYVALLSLAIYAMSYKFYSKQYGSKDDK